MNPKRINADKPHLWKTDIATSVDQFNQWFMRFAPDAFRSTRVKTTEHVKAALIATRDLRSINPATLKENPGALATLRMCTAPPLAVDRLIGLADASKNLVGRMGDGKLPVRMNAIELNAELTKLCRIISKLLDRDIFPWLDAANPGFDQCDRHSRRVILVENGARRNLLSPETRPVDMLQIDELRHVLLTCGQARHIGAGLTQNLTYT